MATIRWRSGKVAAALALAPTLLIVAVQFVGGTGWAGLVSLPSS